MEIALFKTISDLLGNIFSGIAKLTNLPASTRKNYREAFADAFKLLNSALNLIIFRLSNILRESDDQKFLSEVTQLDYFQPWMDMERSILLCDNLRAVQREMDTMKGELISYISVEDWDEMIINMEEIFRGEGELAEFISQKFIVLSGYARSPGAKIDILRNNVFEMRDQLDRQRRELMDQELSLYKII